MLMRLLTATMLVAAPATAMGEAANAPAGGYNEYNAPKELYITGDPLPLTRANMRSGEHISFVACPYVRDSDPTPLWFADYDGQAYFLRAQQNMSAIVRHPQLKHRVLVEGIVSKEPRVDGAIVLNPENISVLPEIDLACDKVLPADGSKIDNPKRPPGPGASGRSRMGSYKARVALAKRLWAAEYKPDPVERVKKEFTFPFAFDSDGVDPLVYMDGTAAVKYARDVEASKIEIVGYRGAALLSNGQTVQEQGGVEERRARAIKAIFDDHPFPKGSVSLRWVSVPPKPDGVSDFANRYVSVIVTPGGGLRQADGAAARP